MRILALVSDAYGGRGGIALYNRHLLRALCEHPQVKEVIALPRSIAYTLEAMPPNLRYVVKAAGGKLRYLRACLRTVMSLRGVDLIVCGHLHLLPFAYGLRLVYNCRVLPVVYGRDAWAPTPHWIVNYFCQKIDAFISIRKMTADRLIQWAGIEKATYYYLPNCIDESRYGVGPKRRDLLEKHGLVQKRVVMTAGRLDSIEYDRCKGFDEMLEVLPSLRREAQNIVYVIMGDGDDRARLERKAKTLGVSDIVVFTGYVAEEEKADYYRLADVFAMPGSNELFDRYPYRFVFLEALACGVPVVGCRLEDPWEINDPESNLIIQVDPNNKVEIIEGVLAALSRPKVALQPGIERFYFVGFKDTLHGIIRKIFAKTESSSQERVM